MRVPVEIVPYSPAHREAVERLNATLAEAGSEWSFPPLERPPAADELPAWDESFVAVEGDEVYGGYILKHRQFFLEGRPIDVGALQLPLSLGQINPEFGHVSVALLFDAIRRQPYLYSLGLGSEQTQFARLLAAAEWQHLTVPFYFSVKSPNRFAREIRLPIDKANMQKVLRVLGRTRLARPALGLRRLLASRWARGATPTSSAEVREQPDFNGSADDLFTTNVGSYTLVADRRLATLRRVYPNEENSYIRLAVVRRDRVIGWALVLDTQMKHDKYFGSMRVGSLADCFSAFDDASVVIAAADEFLSRRGVDIVVSNQLHPQWCRALEATGYEQGPSNFFFYFSEEFRERLAQIADWECGLHLNRGDGEGPAYLLDQLATATDNNRE
jgi:hypothetical protein